MTVYKLPYPASLRDQLRYQLPRQHGTGEPFVHVTPRDREHRKCAAWQADHYEVAAFYVASDPESLGPLEDALRQLPGVYLTTQLWGDRAHSVTVSNPDWPAALGTGRRNRSSLRPQVLALMRDGEP